MHAEVYKRKAPRCPCCAREMPADGVIIDEATRQILVEGRFAVLTPLELRIFEGLYRASPRFLSRPQLLDIGWGIDALEINDRVVDRHIKAIRRKIKRQRLGLRIESEYDGGYRFVRNVKAA